MSDLKPQTILAVEVNDFKRLSVFRATLERTGLNIITGENGAGKSSAIDALVSAITGDLPTVPIRKGATKAKVVVKTPDLIITRRFTEAGSYLEVTNHDGLSYKSPIALLTKGRTPVMFDAGQFAEMKPGDRTAELLRICPVDLDLAKNAADRKKAFDERTVVNRDMKRIEGLLASLPKPPETPPERVDVVALTEALEGLRERERGFQKKRQELKDDIAGQVFATKSLQNQDHKITELELALDQARTERTRLAEIEHLCIAATNASQGIVDTFPDLKPEADKIKADIQRAEQVNAAVEECRQQAQAIAAATGELTDAKKLSETHTTAIDNLDNERAIAIRGAKFPHPGMMIDDHNDIQLDGLPFDQACTSTQYIVGIALAAAAQPTVRVAFIRHGGNLDSNNLAKVDEYARAHSIQVIAEIVQSNREGCIKIVDGASV